MVWCYIAMLMLTVSVTLNLYLMYNWIKKQNKENVESENKNEKVMNKIDISTVILLLVIISVVFKVPTEIIVGLCIFGCIIDFINVIAQKKK